MSLRACLGRGVCKLARVVSRLLDPLFLGLVLGIVPLAWFTKSIWKITRRPHRIALIVAWCGVGGLWLMSSPWMASLCLRRLQPPPVDLKQVLHAAPESRALVVLSGGSRNVYSWVPDAETLDGVTQARIIGAARAYREQGFRWVIVTGIHQEYVNGMADLLVELGVPRERILFDPDAHTTRDNAKNSKRILEQHPEVKQVVLVTSATHMKRAAAYFREEGLSVTPFPVAYESALSWKVLPSSEALWRMNLVFHEALGLLRT